MSFVVLSLKEGTGMDVRRAVPVIDIEYLPTTTPAVGGFPCVTKSYYHGMKNTLAKVFVDGCVLWHSR